MLFKLNKVLVMDKNVHKLMALFLIEILLIIKIKCLFYTVLTKSLNIIYSKCNIPNPILNIPILLSFQKKRNKFFISETNFLFMKQNFYFNAFTNNFY